uniref:photosystem I subunit X n=1 Tax=Pulvinaster venetus TaxID=427767 RepID=UPI001FCCCD03|nr:photosystem I subunit X [Pulvinaster venetus]UNJ17047.1 photosystem I subunit X [Pulvinaster venetus]
MKLKMLNLLISVVPHTSLWSMQVGVILLISNILAIGIGRYAIQVRGLGPSIPLTSKDGFGLPELLATTSLGHIIGAGTILGLNSINVIN